MEKSLSQGTNIAKHFVVLSVTPAVIVGVCLGINKTEGYGTED